MGRKMLIVSIVAFVAVLLSSFFVGVQSSSIDRQRRQAENVTPVDPFPKIENERAVPVEETKTSTAAPTGDNSTITSAANNATVAAETAPETSSSSVTVTVVIVILVLTLLAGAGVFIYLRIRKRRMADYEKKTQIQMSSTSNAGVYVDLTSAPADKEEKGAGSPETERLNKDED